MQVGLALVDTSSPRGSETGWGGGVGGWVARTRVAAAGASSPWGFEASVEGGAEARMQKRTCTRRGCAQAHHSCELLGFCVFFFLVLLFCCFLLCIFLLSPFHSYYRTVYAGLVVSKNLIGDMRALENYNCALSLCRWNFIEL